MKNIQQPPDFHPEGDVFVHTCLVLDKLSESTSENSIEVVYGALFHDIGKPILMIKLIELDLMT